MSATEYASREEWLAARRKVIGSSDVAAILGHGYANQSAYSVWASKVHGVEPEFSADELERMALGHDAEEIVLRAFARQHSMDVRRHERAIVVHPSVPYCGASLDAATPAGEPVEAKFVGPHNWHQWYEEHPPLKYLVQVQHQLWCTEQQQGWLVGLCGQDLRVFRIERHDRLLASIARRLESFWHEHVLTQVPPGIDYSEATAAALAGLFPEDDGTAVWLPEGAGRLLDLRERIKERVSRCERLDREITNRLKAAIGEASYGVLQEDGRCVSWKSQTRKSYVVEESTFRVLRVLKSAPKAAINNLKGPAHGIDFTIPAADDRGEEREEHRAVHPAELAQADR